MLLLFVCQRRRQREVFMFELFDGDRIGHLEKEGDELLVFQSKSLCKSHQVTAAFTKSLCKSLQVTAAFI